MVLPPTELQKVVDKAGIEEDQEFSFAHGDSEVPTSIQRKYWIN